MTELKRQLLAQELSKLKLAAGHLALSQNRCMHLSAHEYANEQMAEIYSAVATLTPTLLSVVPKVATYAEK